jgi:hypothetical protein
MHLYLSGPSCVGCVGRVQVGQKLRYVDAVLLAVLALNALHLVLQAKFQLFQTDLF